MTATPDQPQSQLIYQALGHLGRVKRQLSPQMLEAYDDLLNCRAVKARSKGSNLSRMDRAVIAEQLIREAIESLPPGRDRQVANAVLCAEDCYVGKTVQERLTCMEARFGFNWDNIYDERRQPVLRQIVSYLQRSSLAPQDTRSIFGTVPLGSSGADPPAPADVLDLAEVSAELRYACLGALFAVQFDDELADQLPRLTPDQSALFRRQRMQVLEVCGEHCFEACAHIARYITVPPSRSLLLRLERHGESSLQTLLGVVRTATPSFSDMEWLLLAQYGSRRDNSDTALVQAARYLYQSEWRLWQTRSAKTADAQSSLGDLASAAGGIFMLCRPHVDLRLVAHRAQALAHKTLAYYYDFDTNNPSLRGGSLRDLVDSYMNKADTQDGIAI